MDAETLFPCAPLNTNLPWLKQRPPGFHCEQINPNASYPNRPLADRLYLRRRHVSLAGLQGETDDTRLRVITLFASAEHVISWSIRMHFSYETA